MDPLTTTDPERIDEYTLEGRLGAGGYGVVYAATDAEGGRVALKVLRPELADNPGLKERLAREGKALGRVGGDRNVEIYKVVTEGTHTYLVMELVEGETLKERVERDGPLACAQPDPHSDREEEVGELEGLLDRGPEADDRERADQTQGEGEGGLHDRDDEQGRHGDEDEDARELALVGEDVRVAHVVPGQDVREDEVEGEIYEQAVLRDLIQHHLVPLEER